MEYTNLNIRTSKETKAAAEKIFDELGISTSTAFNMFLKAVIRENGLPFELRLDVPNAETVAAIEEGRRMAHDPNAVSFASVEEMRKALGL